MCCDANVSIVQSNLGLQQRLGYPSNIAKGLTLTQLAVEGERRRLMCRLTAVAGPPTSFEVECRRVDGEPCATEWHIARGRDDRMVMSIPRERQEP